MKKKIPAAMKTKWTGIQQSLFLLTYEKIKGMEHAFTHPLAAAMPKNHFETIAHNAAFCAACALGEIFEHEK